MNDPRFGNISTRLTPDIMRLRDGKTPAVCIRYAANVVCDATIYDPTQVDIACNGLEAATVKSASTEAIAGSIVQCQVDGCPASCMLFFNEQGPYMVANRAVTNSGKLLSLDFCIKQGDGNDPDSEKT